MNTVAQAERVALVPPAKLWRNWIRFHYDDEPSETKSGSRTFPSKELAEQAWHEVSGMGLSAI